MRGTASISSQRYLAHRVVDEAAVMLERVDEALLHRGEEQICIQKLYNKRKKQTKTERYKFNSGTKIQKLRWVRDATGLR